MSGFGLTHSDVGGYTTIMHMTRSKELLMRWEEMNAFSPLMRSHEGNQPVNNVQFADDAELLAQLARTTKMHAALKPYLKKCVAENAERVLSAVQGIIVPGGFGGRGIEGMVLAAKYAREHHVPYFGICLGMQIAVIEFARNAAGLAGANSHEFDEDSPHQVIHFMPGQNDEIDKGGTLRLGKYPCVLREGTVIARCYGKSEISERHRHRYEFANEYREPLEKAGLCLSGQSPDGRLIETVEIPGEDFFVGVQFHPEFKSRPNRPHPLFLGFIGAALRK